MKKNPAFEERRMNMKIVKTIDDFARMHIDLGLPMPKKTFQETIPMTHRIPKSFPSVDEIFDPFYEDNERYLLTTEDVVIITRKLRNIWASAINTDYKGLGTGNVFKDQLVHYSQSDEGKRYGLQATRNFRLGGAIHFETNAQAERFLNDWITVRKVLEDEEE